MSVFKKGWAERFKTDATLEDASVRAAFQQSVAPHPRQRRALKPGRLSAADVVSETLAGLPKLLTLQEAAKILRFKDRESVTNLIRQGHLVGRKVGREWRIPLAGLAKYLIGDNSTHVA